MQRAITCGASRYQNFAGEGQREDSDFDTLSSVGSCYVKLKEEANCCAPASVIQIYQLQILPRPKFMSLEQRYKMVCQYCVESPAPHMLCALGIVETARRPTPQNMLLQEAQNKHRAGGLTKKKWGIKQKTDKQ